MRTVGSRGLGMGWFWVKRRDGRKPSENLQAPVTTFRPEAPPQGVPKINDGTAKKYHNFPLNIKLVEINPIYIQLPLL